MPRPPLLVVVALLVAGLLAPLALARSSAGPRLTIPGGTHGDRIPSGADRPLRKQLAKLRRGRIGAASVASGLRDGAWCGVEQAADDTTYQAYTGPRIKIIYAYPSDRPDRFATMRDVIQADARDMAEMVLAASGQTKTLRFDVGTVCGAGYVDIMSVRLPRTSAQYRQLAATSRMQTLRTDLAPNVASMTGKRNYLVYADGILAGDGVAGIGGLYNDDRPGAENLANNGGLWAMAFGDGSDPAFLPARLTTVLHEVSHNLGAVQNSAPHTTQAGHCNDGLDVMCYADGGPRSAMTQPCATQAYDCGADDYFNPSPAPGSYLATSWNVYRSVFLCAASQCVGTDVGAGNPTPTADIVARDAAGRPVTSATAGTPVTLDGSGSRDDAAVAEFQWDVGADGTVESRDQRFTTPLGAGAIPIRLTVRDGYGAAGAATTTIQVAAAPVVPATPSPAPAPPRRAISELRSSLDTLRAGLRAAQRRGRLKVPFTATQQGWLVAGVSLRGRAIGTASRRIRAKRTDVLSVPLSAPARRRLNKGGSVTVRLTFYGDDGETSTARRAVTVPRR